MKVRQKGLCDEGEVKNGLCNGREGVPITNLPPPKHVFSPHPLRWKTGNAFLPQSYKLSDYQPFI